MHQLCALGHGGILRIIKPALWKDYLGGRTLAATGAIGVVGKRRRVGPRREEFAQILKGIDTGEARPDLTTNREATQVPANVLADIAASLALALVPVSYTHLTLPTKA